jgi:hypothetical protein
MWVILVGISGINGVGMGMEWLPTVILASSESS